MPLHKYSYLFAPFPSLQRRRGRAIKKKSRSEEARTGRSVRRNLQA